MIKLSVFDATLLFTETVQRLFSLGNGGIGKKKNKFHCSQHWGPLSLQAYSRYSPTPNHAVHTFLKKTLWFLWQVSWSISGFTLLLWLSAADAWESYVRRRSSILRPTPAFISPSLRSSQWLFPSRRMERCWPPQLGLLLQGRGTWGVGGSKRMSLEACERPWTLPSAVCLQRSGFGYF